MGFLSLAMTDSHFFERHRFGRLVAALEDSGIRLGIGVGEDAAVEINLETGELRGVSIADSLLVDIGAMKRDGLARRGIRAKIITAQTRVSLPLLLRMTPEPQRPNSTDPVESIPTVEPGQNRQLSSWRYFKRAERERGKRFELTLDGYRQISVASGDFSVTDIEPLAK